MRLNGFDLNQLICLDALLTERNVSRAAARVHLSQSAMSSVLARLRSHFNDPLLVRSGRRLVLTPFAQSLIGPLNDLIGRAQRLTTRVPEQNLFDVEREFKIAASDYLMTTCMAPAIGIAREKFANLIFDVLPLTSASAQQLRSGELDLLCAGQALEVGQPPDELLFEDRFVCVACSKHEANEEAWTRDNYLNREQVVIRYFEHRLAFEDEEAFRREGLKRPRRIVLWSYSLIPEIVCGTSMIATVPRRLASRLCERWPLKILPFPFEHQPFRIYAYWHSSRQDDVVLQRFMAIVRASAA